MYMYVYSAYLNKPEYNSVMYIHIYIYAYTYILIYIYTYMHTYIHTYMCLYTIHNASFYHTKIPSNITPHFFSIYSLIVVSNC